MDKLGAAAGSMIVVHKSYRCDKVNNETGKTCGAILAAGSGWKHVARGTGEILLGVEALATESTVSFYCVVCGAKWGGKGSGYHKSMALTIYHGGRRLQLGVVGMTIEQHNMFDAIAKNRYEKYERTAPVQNESINDPDIDTTVLNSATGMAVWDGIFTALFHTHQQIYNKISSKQKRQWERATRSVQEVLGQTMTTVVEGDDSGIFRAANPALELWKQPNPRRP